MKEKINRLMHNKMALGIFCIVISLLLSLFTINFKTSSSETKNVVVTTKKIEVGDKITDEMLTFKKISGDTSGLITNKEDIIGKYAKVPMVANDYVTNDKLNIEALYGSAYLENLGDDDRAISVSITTNAKGLSGKLESGDIVSIILSNTENEEGTKNTYIPDELKYVEVISVSDTSGNDVGSNEDAEKIGSTVTLLTREEQSLILARAEGYEDIHFQLVYRGNDERKQQLLQEQKSIITREISEKITETETNTKIQETTNNQ
ncbi:Flp pilus assembly protein CpaB [[Clostridium] colinum]|uniref:Flp pilus assembly protein CpaB n=1 Tax=[Clostridium] colinum TaxID=36835 RepID=UPI00202434F3|nr:Flp pilus assembly protein CpaB [[Clostridium] colinum]